MNKDDLEVICKVTNLVQYDAIKEILENNNIPYTFRHRGLSIGRAYELPFSGDSGIEILVPSKFEENAKEIIKPILKTLT